MKTYIALLRGINVGGRNKLPMAELRGILGSLGYQQAKTYIQSGNAVFQTDETDRVRMEEAICATIQAQHGFAPRVLLLTLEELDAAIAVNPYPAADENPKTVHIYFLAAEPTTPNLTKLEQLRTESEHFVLTKQVFYLYTPDGISRSKLAAQIEKALGVPATARNWRSTNKVRDLATSH